MNQSQRKQKSFKLCFVCTLNHRLLLAILCAIWMNSKLKKEMESRFLAAESVM